jgi:ABC-2 type transport system permease protein
LSAAALVIVGSISVVGVGILSGILPLLFPERGEQMSFMVQAVVLLISGVYNAVNVLPGWLRAASSASPATSLLRGLRGAIINGQGLGPQGANLALLAVVGLVMVPGSLLAFGASARWAGTPGRLKRQG